MKTQGIRALPAGRDLNGHANESRLPHRRSKMTQTTLPRHPIENDNPLTGLHGRQRAPLNRLHRCLITQGMSHSTSGTPDEEVDYGSCGSSANPSTDSDHKWSTSENDSQD